MGSQVKEAHKRSYRPPRSEQAVAAASGVLVLTLIAYLLGTAIFATSSPPEIILKVESIIPVGGNYLVTFDAENRGSKAVADVHVRGHLRRGANEEEVQMVLQFVAAHSLSHGGLYFRSDPREGDLQLLVDGYREP